MRRYTLIKGMPKTETLNTWIPGLDLLRCTAVFLVLIGHAKLFLPGESREFFKLFFPMPAAWGVELFFSLSGFLIGQRWVAMNLKGDRYVWKKVKLFVRNRLLRTMPTYWLLLSLLLIVGAINLGPRVNLLAFLSNFTLTNWIFNTAYALPVSWTLAIEEFSYLIIGGSVLIIQPMIQTLKPKSQRKLLPLLPSLLILIGVFVRISSIQTSNWYELSLSPWHRLDALAYGMLLACWLDSQEITTRSRSCWQQIWPPTMLIASILLLQQWRIILMVDLEPTPTVGGVLFGALLVPAVGLVTSGWVMLASAWRSSGSKLLDKIIRHLAQISYSVYLIHIPLRTILMQQWTAKTHLIGFLHLILYLFATIILGDLTYRLFERPFIRLRRKLDLSE